MPTAPPGGAVLAPASAGDGKEVITSTNTTVRLLSCFHEFFILRIYEFFSSKCLLKCSKLRKRWLFWQKICFLFQLKNIWEKVRRLVVWKFVKTCCELDNSYKAWIFPEKNGLKRRTPELDPKQPLLLSREPLPFTLLSKLRTQFLLCTSIAKKVKVKYRFF